MRRQPRGLPCLHTRKFLRCLVAAAIGFSSAAIAKKKGPGDADVIAARTKIFGIDNVDQKNGNVDKDKVIFSWITNASYAVAAHGQIFLLDSFVTRIELSPGRTPIVIGDLVNLQPDAIFLGHGHFDHADNAAFISAETGAPIYASPETCDNMGIDATNNFNNHYTTVSSVTCISLTKRGSIPGSEVMTVKDFEPDISLSVFTHLHSTNTGADDPNAVPIATTSKGACVPTTTHQNTFPCNLQDPRDPALFPAGTSLTCPSTGPKPAGCMNIGTSRQGNGGPIALFWVFTVNGPNHFRFVWHNSTGDIVDSCALPNNTSTGAAYLAPNQDTRGCFAPTVTVNGMTVGANLAAIMDSLRPVDVQLGSVVSLGFNQNGERDIVSYIAHVQPKVFIPGHVTAVAVEGSSLEWKVGFFDALRATSSFEPANFPNGINPKGATYSQIPQANWPEVPWLVDPNDYIRPLVYTPSDARWKK